MQFCERSFPLTQEFQGLKVFLKSTIQSLHLRQRKKEFCIKERKVSLLLCRVLPLFPKRLPSVGQISEIGYVSEEKISELCVTTRCRPRDFGRSEASPIFDVIDSKVQDPRFGRSDTLLRKCWTSESAEETPENG